MYLLYNLGLLLVTPPAQPSLHSPFLLFVHPLARYARVSLSPLIPPPYRRIGRSPARRATSDGERRDVRWGGGKGQWAARAEPRKWREAARRSLHGPFRSLITSGREPGQERDTPLVHPLLTSLPRSWRISLFVSLSRDRIPHSFVPSVAYRRYVGSLLRAPLVSFGSSFVSCSALRARRMVRINNNCMDLYIGLIKPVRKGTKDKFISQ